MACFIGPLGISNPSGNDTVTFVNNTAHLLYRSTSSRPSSNFIVCRNQDLMHFTVNTMPLIQCELGSVGGNSQPTKLILTYKGNDPLTDMQLNITSATTCRDIGGEPIFSFRAVSKWLKKLSSVYKNFFSLFIIFLNYNTY